MKKHALVMLVALFSGLMVFGQPQKGPRGGGFGYGKGYNNASMPCMNRIPDLTEEQTQKINDLRIDMLKETQPVRNQIRELKAKCQTLITSENPDRKAIDTNIDERAKLQAEIMKSHARFRTDVLQVLTDDQKVFFNNPGPGKCRMQNGRGPRGMGGPGMWNN